MESYLPKQSNIPEGLAFTFDFYRKICVKLPPNVDSYSIILDCSNVSMKNFDMEFEKCDGPVLEYFAERLHLCYIINYNKVMQAIMTLMWPFIPKRTREKVKMVKIAELQKTIDIEVLPEELGGTNTTKVIEIMQ